MNIIVPSLSNTVALKGRRVLNIFRVTAVPKELSFGQNHNHKNTNLSQMHLEGMCLFALEKGTCLMCSTVELLRAALALVRVHPGIHKDSRDCLAGCESQLLFRRFLALLTTAAPMVILMSTPHGTTGTTKRIVAGEFPHV